MPDRKSSALIGDMLRAIDHVSAYTHNISFLEFSKNFMAAEACLYNIQVPGEAVSRLPEAVKLQYPDVPWALIKGMRNRLIHEYFGTDLPVVWDVITIELPVLKPILEKIQKEL